jgi:hypothetical protein
MKKEIKDLAQSLLQDYKASVLALNAMGKDVDLSAYLCMFLSGAVKVMEEGGCSEEEIEYIKETVSDALTKEIEDILGKSEEESEKEEEECGVLKVSLSFKKDEL